MCNQSRTCNNTKKKISFVCNLRRNWYKNNVWTNYSYKGKKIFGNILYTLTKTIYQFLHRKHNACSVGHPEMPNTCRIYVGISSNIPPPTRQIWLEEPSRRRPAVEVEAVQWAPLGPIILCETGCHPPTSCERVRTCCIVPYVNRYWFALNTHHRWERYNFSCTPRII